MAADSCGIHFRGSNFLNSLHLLWPLTFDLPVVQVPELSLTPVGCDWESGVWICAESPPRTGSTFSIHALIQAGVTIAGLCCQWRPASSACYRSLTLHSVTASASQPVSHPLPSALHWQRWKKEAVKNASLIETRHVNWQLQWAASSRLNHTFTLKFHFASLQCSKMTSGMRWTTVASRVKLGLLWK